MNTKQNKTKAELIPTIDLFLYMRDNLNLDDCFFDDLTLWNNLKAHGRRSNLNTFRDKLIAFYNRYNND